MQPREGQLQAIVNTNKRSKRKIDRIKFFAPYIASNHCFEQQILILVEI